MEPIALGDQAPEFSLISTNDEQYSFEEYRKKHGGWHLLVFFRGSW